MYSSRDGALSEYECPLQMPFAKHCCHWIISTKCFLSQIGKLCVCLWGEDGIQFSSSLRLPGCHPPGSVASWRFPLPSMSQDVLSCVYFLYLSNTCLLTMKIKLENSLFRVSWSLYMGAFTRRLTEELVLGQRTLHHFLGMILSSLSSGAKRCLVTAFLDIERYWNLISNWWFETTYCDDARWKPQLLSLWSHFFPPLYMLSTG